MLPSTPPQTNKCLPPPPPTFLEWEDVAIQVHVQQKQLPLLPDIPRGNGDDNRRFALPSKEMIRKLQHRPSKVMLPSMGKDEDTPAPPAAVTPMAPSSRHPLPVSASLEILKPRPSKRFRRRVLDFNDDVLGAKSPLLMTSNKGPISTPVS